MMMRPAAAFGIGRISLVMVIEREDVVAVIISAQNVVSVTIVAFAQPIQKSEARRDEGVVTGGEAEAELCRDYGHGFAPFLCRDGRIDSDGDSDYRENDENEKLSFHRRVF